MACAYARARVCSICQKPCRIQTIAIEPARTLRIHLRGVTRELSRLTRSRVAYAGDHDSIAGSGTLIQPMYSRCLSTHHAQGANSQIPSALHASVLTLGGGELLLVT